MSDWPGWFYGPNGQSAIFKSAAEVPKGWEDAPQKVRAAQPVEIVEEVLPNSAVPISAELPKAKRAYKRKVK